MSNPAALRPARMPIAVAIAAALWALAGSGHAFEAKVSGHVNRMIIQVDDGTQSELFHADNVNSQTRFRFTGTQDVMSNLKAGINWEVGYTSNPSSAISITSRSVDATFNERHAEVYLLGNWGKFSMGQGDGAANGGLEVDLSGTSVINYSGITDVGGNFAFRQGDAFGPAISSTIGNLDFESRYDRVRYDTPKFGPVSAAASYGTKGNNNVTEVAAWLASELAGGKIAGGLGWSREDVGGATGNDDTFGGSVSYLSPIGINVTLGFANEENDNAAVPKKKFGYGKLGYLAGKHAVSIDYAKGTDFGTSGDDSKMVGFGYVYTAQNWIELYTGFKRHTLDRPGTSFDAVRFVSAGTRVKF